MSKTAYRSIDTLFLHDSGKHIIPANSETDCPWWAAETEDGKAFELDGRTIKDLAEIFNCRTYPLTLKSNTGEKFQDLQTTPLPFLNVTLSPPYESPKYLLGNLENGVLNLIAIMPDNTAWFTSHSGAFDIVWSARETEA